MINKTNLKKLANSSPYVRDFLIEFSKVVIMAKTPEEYYNLPDKKLYDRILDQHDICSLDVKTYLENVTEIYNILKSA